MCFYQVYLLQKVLYQTLSEEKSIPNKIRQTPLPKKYWKKQSTQNSEISIKTMSELSGEKFMPNKFRPKMVSFCFVGDSFLQAFGRECLFRGSLAENFVTYFLVVTSLRLLGKHFLFGYFFAKKSLQNLSGRELLF